MAQGLLPSASILSISCLPTVRARLSRDLRVKERAVIETRQHTPLMEGCLHFSFFLQVLAIKAAVSVTIVFICYLIQDVTPTPFWT